MRKSPRGYFECGDPTHFIVDCPKRNKLDSSNKYDYTNRKDYNKGDNKKNCFETRRRSSRRSYPECVLPSATSTSRVTMTPAQRRMRRSSASKVTSPAFASWANLQDTSSTPTPTLTLIYSLRVFLRESSSLRVLSGTKISCFARFSMRTRS
jgi:hypothetical protein